MNKQMTLFEIEAATEPPPVDELANRLFESEFDEDPVKRSRQRRLLWDSLQGKPKTRMQLAVETGIMRSSICPIIDDWLRKGHVYFAGRDRCPITGHKADFFTANKKVFLENVLVQEEEVL